MAVTKAIDRDNPNITLAEMFASAFVKKTSDGIPGLRVIIKAVAESDLTPMVQCAGGAPLSIEETVRNMFQLTTDGKIALVLYEAESTT